MNSIVPVVSRVIFLVALTFGLGTVVLWALNIQPPVQLVDPSSGGADLVFQLDDGVLMWHTHSEGGLVRDAGCVAEETVNVILASDSVLHVWRGHTDDSFRERLRRRLLPEGGCVIDASAAGFFPYQQLHGARLAHQEFEGDVLVFVVWKMPTRFSKVGEEWWDLRGRPVDADGYPVLAFPFIRPLHQWLFRNSRLWAYLTVSLAEPDESLVYQGAGDYETAISWAIDEGMKVILLEAVWLDRSFEESIRERRHRTSDDFRYVTEQFAAKYGATYLYFDELLLGHSPEEVRLDTCCHFNELGHEVLEAKVGPHVLDAVRQVRDSRKQ